MTQPYVLLLPTYGGRGTKGAVPKPVIDFLNQQHNRQFLRGVIASGNSNFGETYAIADNIISTNAKYHFSIVLNY